MSAILTPTADNGASGKATEMTYGTPGRTMLGVATPPSELSQLNMDFVLDKLSDIVTHERCGTHLYRTAATRSNNPMLRSKYTKFGEQTARHVELGSQLVVLFGGDPMYVSPAARATEGLDAHLVQATYLLDGSADPVVAEMTLLNAVFIAETIDHDNWSSLKELVMSIDDSPLQQEALDIIAEIERDEDEHLDWARSMRARLTMMEAKSSVMAGATMRMEETVARIRSWFSSEG